MRRSRVSALARRPDRGSYIPVPGCRRVMVAQTGTATVNGQVTDESGGVLPGATVTATSPALQVP